MFDVVQFYVNNDILAWKNAQHFDTKKIAVFRKNKYPKKKKKIKHNVVFL